MNEEILRKGIIDAYVHLRKTNSDIPSDVLDWIKDTCLDRVKNCSIPDVSQRSELLKAEDPERSFDEYIEKYFSEQKIELVYKTLYDGKERTEKEIIKIYKKAHRL